MPRIVLLVGTRKGCFILESDLDRREWSTRGPFCEGWPIYHAVQDPASGAIYAAAASEWHGAGVWRSGDLGESWELSSEGLAYAEDSGLKLSKLAGLTVAHGRVLVGAEAAGVFESRDGGASWSLLSTLDGQPGRDAWNDPARQPPGHLGVPAMLPHPDEASRFWAIVQGFGIFETTDDGGSWTPRNRGLRADWPLENPEVGYCVHKLVMSPTDHDRLYQQNHVGMHRSDDAGRSWVEITDGLPTEFGFAAAAHPHDRDSFYVIPLDPGHARCMPDGRVAVWRTRDAGSSWQRLDSGLPQRDAYLGVLREGLAIDPLDVPGLYFGTSTGQVFASADEGETWSEIASYLPAIASVEVTVLD
ncbi:MAG: WD40/YVTN/BNR-like repeat-containing protein [Gaiellales bacterium]